MRKVGIGRKGDGVGVLFFFVFGGPRGTRGSRARRHEPRAVIHEVVHDRGAEREHGNHLRAEREERQRASQLAHGF